MAKHATTLETIKIHEVLKRVLTVQDGGLCSYNDGYTDDKVAREIDPNLSKHSVMHVRTSLFGLLVKKEPSSDDGERRLQEAIRSAEEAVRVVKNVVECYNDLQVRFDKLVTMLSLNQIIDCKHLSSAKTNGSTRRGDGIEHRERE